MAFGLNLSYCQCNNCKQLTLTDISADTSVTPNLTWDDIGMPLMSDVSTAFITITSNSNTSVSYQLDVSAFFHYKYLGRCYGITGGTIITGVDTSFLSYLIPGNILTGSDMLNNYTIASVDSDTQVTLTTALLEDFNNDWIFNTGGATPTATDLIFNIISDDIGLATDNSFPDDVYNIIYTVLDGNTGITYTFETNILLYCSAECCVQRKIQQIPQYYHCNNCDSSYIKSALEAWGLLLALKSSARCGAASESLNTLNTLKKICNYQPCIGCK